MMDNPDALGVEQFLPRYRALLSALGPVEQPPNELPIAYTWFEAGVPAEQGIQWLAAGYTPAAAAHLIEAGANPHLAREAELAAMDAADGGHRHPTDAALRASLKTALDGKSRTAPTAPRRDPHDPRRGS
jgi:hypothetical protein